MIAIIDYGVGNLFSLRASLDKLGIENILTADKSEVDNCSHIILPGVGAFGAAIEKLNKTGMADVVKSQAVKGKPILGICLGMQLLFNKSYEYGEHTGLELIGGNVCPLEGDINSTLKIPHMGWNSLNIHKQSPILKYTKDGDYVYYVHSFYARDCADNIVATSSYDIDVTGLVQNDNVFGAQFHPEKSGDVGLNMLKAFGEIK